MRSDRGAIVVTEDETNDEADSCAGQSVSRSKYQNVESEGNIQPPIMAPILTGES